MRYLLVVGFFCKVYRKNPVARIFINNKLIDEFDISQQIESLPEAFASKKDRHRLDPIFEIEAMDNKIKNLPPLKFYEIDIADTVKNLNFKIFIQNDDCKYINGFMGDSTLIKLRICHLFPLNYKILNKLKKLKSKKTLTKNYAWYRNYDTRMYFELSCIWNGQNGQILGDYTKSKLNDLGNNFNVGGSGYFACDLFKKYNFFTTNFHKRYRYNFSFTLIDHFLNKYSKHAN